MASLGALLLYSAYLTFVLSFVLFFYQNLGFCSHKIALIKKDCIYIMAKENCFPSSSVLENPFHQQSEKRENDFTLYTKRIYFFGQVTAQSRTDQGTL